MHRKTSPPARRALASDLAGLGLNLLKQEEWPQAEPVLRECLALREQTQPDDWSTFNARSLLGGSQLGQKKYGEAEPLVLSGYEGMKAREAKIPAQGKPRMTQAAKRVVELYEAWGRKDKSDEWRKKLSVKSPELPANVFAR